MLGLGLGLGRALQLGEGVSPNFGDLYIPGATSHWTMDEETGAPWDIISAHHATEPGGAVPSVAGKFGNARATDGAKKILIPAHADLATPDFTLHFWMKTTVGGYGYICNNFRQSLLDNTTAQLTISDGTITFQDFVYSVPGWSNWNMVTITRASVAGGGAPTVKAYINADLQRDLPWGWGNFTIGNIRFGEDFADGSGTTVDSVSWFNRAITADEVTALYNGGAGVTYNFVPYAVPALTDASVAIYGNALHLVIATDDRLDPLTVSTDSEALEGFSIEVNSVPVALGPVRIDLETGAVSALITTFVEPGDTITVSYDGSDDIENELGSPLAPFIDQPVTNDSTQTSDTGSKGYGVMATKGYAGVAELGGTEAYEAIFSSKIELPYGVSAGWKLTYLGYGIGTDNYEIDCVVITAEQPNTVPIKFAVKFGGMDGITVAAAGIEESDAINIALPPGTILRHSMLYRGETGVGLPYQTWGVIEPDVDGANAGARGTFTESDIWHDNVATSNPVSLVTYAGIGSIVRGFGPMAIVGTPHPSYVGTEITILFIGDSINIQNNDYGGGPFGARGWNGRFCSDDIAYVIFGEGGSGTGGFTNTVGSPLFNYLMGTGADDRKITHLVDAYGINELRSQRADGLDSDYTWDAKDDVATLCDGLGISTVFTTVTPMNADWLAGHASHGDAAAQFAYFVAQRADLNERVRDDWATLPGAIGIIDYTVPVENDPVTNDNVWVAGMNWEGIHPREFGHQAMAGTVNVAVFTSNPNPLPV